MNWGRMSWDPSFKKEQSALSPHHFLSCPESPSNEITMWNRMLFPLVTSLLVLLSAAAPVSENPALSHALVKRATRCSSIWGHNIVPADCTRALETMRRLPQFKADGGEGILASPISDFSRSAQDSRFRMPQSITEGTCTIFIDLPSSLSELPAIRSIILFGAQRILDECVNAQRIGGVDDGIGFNTVIGSEQSLDPSMRHGWEACKAHINTTPFDPHVQCLLHDLEVEAEAIARHRGPPDHSTSKK